MSFNEYHVKARLDVWRRSAAKDHWAAEARRASAARRQSAARRDNAAAAQSLRLLRALLRLVNA
jgi:hypothetical protein